VCGIHSTPLTVRSIRLHDKKRPVAVLFAVLIRFLRPAIVVGTSSSPQGSSSLHSISSSVLIETIITGLVGIGKREPFQPRMATAS